jgi:hypothetical protein
MPARYERSRQADGGSASTSADADDSLRRAIPFMNNLTDPRNVASPWSTPTGWGPSWLSLLTAFGVESARDAMRPPKRYADGGAPAEDERPRSPFAFARDADVAGRSAFGGLAGYADGGAPRDVDTSDVLARYAAAERGTLAPLYEPLERLAREGHEAVDKAYANNDIRDTAPWNSAWFLDPALRSVLGRTVAGASDLAGSGTKLLSKGIDYLRGRPEATEITPEDLGNVAPAAFPALRAVPRSVKIPTAAGLVASLIGREAEAKEKRQESPLPASIPGSVVADARTDAVANDPVLLSLKVQIAAQEKISNASPDAQTRTNRERAGIEAARLRDQYSARLTELTKSNLPFAQAHPDLAANWPLVQLGAPALTGYLTKTTGNLAERAARAPWNRTVDAAERYMFPRFMKPDPARGTYQADKAAEYLKAEHGPALRGASDFMRDTGLPVLAGTVAGAETSLFPEQYNKRNAPIGSKEREDAERRLEDFWATAAPGAALGFLGGLGGSHLVPTVGPGRYPGPSTEALKRLMGAERDASLGVPAPRVPQGSGAELPRAPLSAEARALPEIASPLMDQSIVEAARPGLAARLGDYRKAAGQPPALEAPSSRLSPPSSDIPLLPGMGLNSRGVPYDLRTGHPIRSRYWQPKDEGKGGSRSRSKDSESSAAKSEANEGATPEKISDPADPLYWEGKNTRGMKDGGFIDGLTRKYASGGAVGGTGLLHSDVPGRTDHLPLNVKADSFVIPADIVSALGEGNTLAGSKQLDQMLGTGRPQDPRNFARGGDVPILAAGGEYMIAPDDVARIGGGDMKHGHRILESLIKQVRSGAIKRLKSLPGPARG